MIKIEYCNEIEDVYDITVAENENFYANDILVHNCAEISLPVRPMGSTKTITYRGIETEDLQDKISQVNYDGGKIIGINPIMAGPSVSFDMTVEEDDSRIALCTLSAINWGKIKKPSDFEKPCRLAVRALDALLDYQRYPVVAARLSTMEHRPVGVGIINFAYWLAKNGLKYSDDSALAMVDEYAEAWSYYLIKASVDLAKEKGACLRNDQTKYSLGIMPIDTRKLDVDQLVPHTERMPWVELREEAKTYGIRNATLMALMPSECQHWANKIALSDGNRLNFHEILEQKGYDWQAVEETGIPQRFSLPLPISVKTRNGDKMAYEIYYNGVQEIFEVEFDDDTYHFTGNHKLLVLRNNKEEWVEVQYLSEEDLVIDIKSMKKIKSIRRVGSDHTWDLTVDGDEYILPNGVVSHNTSAQIANATNGIEPPRAFVSIKQSKDGVLAQVVPKFEKLKNKYDLLWDQESPVGYLKICAILQKYIDQAISVNTSYNPKFYDEGKIPMSELLQHLLLFYKWGGKNLYYSNTNDQAGEVDVDAAMAVVQSEEETCDSCAI